MKSRTEGIICRPSFPLGQGPGGPGGLYRSCVSGRATACTGGGCWGAASSLGCRGGRFWRSAVMWCCGSPTEARCVCCVHAVCCRAHSISSMMLYCLISLCSKILDRILSGRTPYRSTLIVLSCMFLPNLCSMCSQSSRCAFSFLQSLHCWKWIRLDWSFRAMSSEVPSYSLHSSLRNSNPFPWILRPNVRRLSYVWPPTCLHVKDQSSWDKSATG